MSLRDLILNDVPVAEVKPVTLRGEKLYVREMNGTERDAYEAQQLSANKAGSGLENFRARLLVRVIVDKDGNRVFGDDDVAALGKLPAREIRKAFDIASKLNALTPEDEADLVKNS